MTGIYRFLNTKTGDSYIGQSRNCEARRCGHLAMLKRGDHHAVRFQASYNEHGDAAFVFEVLEVCARANLNDREAEWIWKLKPTLNGFMLGAGKNECKEDALRIIAARHKLQTIARTRKEAKETGTRSECRHCRDVVSGKVVCDQCGEWLKRECEECHNELAHSEIANQNIHVCGSDRGDRMRTSDADPDAFGRP